jgi:hypothetical protein
VATLRTSDSNLRDYRTTAQGNAFLGPGVSPEAELSFRAAMIYAPIAEHLALPYCANGKRDRLAVWKQGTLSLKPRAIS